MKIRCKSVVKNSSEEEKKKTKFTTDPTKKTPKSTFVYELFDDNIDDFGGQEKPTKLKKYCFS